MYNIPDQKEKFLCAALYLCPLLASGSLIFLVVSFAPILYFLYTNAKKITMKDFVKYHCFQAVLLNMILFFLPGLFGLLISTLANLFEILMLSLSSLGLPESIAANGNNLIASIAKFYGYAVAIYSILIKVLALYAVVWTFRGKYTYIPPISQAVNQILR